MSILQALDGYYDRMAARNEVEPPGCSRENVSFAIELSAKGEPVAVRDLRQQSGKKLVPQKISVPAAIKRTVGIASNLFWDKSAYVLGRTLGTGKRTADEHKAFRDKHLELLAGTQDEGLLALRRFLEKWKPERFDTAPFVADMLDANIVFRLDGDRGYLHEREASRAIVAAQSISDGETAFCLVTGKRAPIRRLHPVIKNVDGAQSSGAALVSFNLDAFTSYAKEQGDNAPTSEAAAFRYGEALNRLLDRTSPNRLKIGDATVVFWADTSETVQEKEAAAAENFMMRCFGQSRETADEDEQEASLLSDALQKLSKGRPVEDLQLGLKSGTRFHVLGLSPNAARLSVRFWLTDDFSAFARRLAEHAADLKLEPPPSNWGSKPPSIQRLLVRTTALMEKFENIPPLLAGELTRAVLSGTRYPHSLMAAAITRLRAGDDASNGWHAAVIKAVLARDLRLRHSEEEMPVSLDRDNPNQAYQLGRLFAAVETAQRAALGKVNATIRDRYFGAASATPAAVFPILLRGVQNHLGKLRKTGKGIWLEREIEEITSRLSPQMPRALRLEEQGRFALGYYHQRRGQFASKDAEAEIEGLENQGEQDV
jgi:CRISPR-associated protein Cas8c/Csd1, subtype I-C/DVULG